VLNVDRQAHALSHTYLYAANGVTSFCDGDVRLQRANIVHVRELWHQL
jgi:hypothetical protein